MIVLFLQITRLRGYNRVAEVGSLSARAKIAEKISSSRKYVVFARNFKFTNLSQYNMQYIPCNSALLAQEKCGNRDKS